MSIRGREGRPPALSNSAIAKLIKDHFRFSLVNEATVKELPSYVDRNIYFRGTPELTDTSHCYGELVSSTDQPDELEYVLKLNNPFFASYDILCGIDELLVYLHRKGINKCIYPLKSRKGDDTLEISREHLLTYESLVSSEVSVSEGTEVKFLMRVVTYIPGECLDHVEKQYLTPGLLYDIGNYIGRVDAVLSVSFLSFSSPSSLSLSLSLSLSYLCFIVYTCRMALQIQAYNNKTLALGISINFFS